MTITKVAVIGAGSMGSAIAALCASAGLDVVLLDQDAAGAQRGKDLQLKRGGFYLPEHAERVTVGGAGDYSLLSDRDWVIEAIFEDLGAKHALYQAIEPYLADSALLSSNTSTLPLGSLLAGVAPGRREQFAITHFFNPPKVMRLVELIASGETEDRLRQVIEHTLGKVALECRDTPGFIANRVGCYWLAAGVARAREFSVGYELADAAFGRAFGIPRTGVFGLLDFIGLQLVGPIWDSLEGALDPYDPLLQVPLGKDPFIAELVSRGLTGRTGEGGFYRGRGEVIDDSFTYVPRQTPQDPVVGLRDPLEVMETDSPGGRYARALFLDTLAYCCTVAPEIADHVGLIDDGLKLGFGWKKGVFELADAVGLDWIRFAYQSDGEGREVPALLEAAIEAGGFYPSAETVLDSAGAARDLPPRDGVVTLASLDLQTIVSSPAGAVHLLDEGIGIIDLHTPMNSLSVEALELIRSALDAVDEHGIKALVVGNDAPVFCSGAHLPSLADAAESGSPDRIRELLDLGSRTLRALKFAPVPVVGAVRGVALGGGLETLLSCDRVVVHADARLGFPELTVGLYPGWTGTVALLERLVDAGDADPHQRAFDFITAAKPAANAFAAQQFGLLRGEDMVLMSFDHVLARAIEEAKSLAAGYSAPADRPLPGYAGDRPLDAEWPLEGTTDNDHAIAARLAEMYTGAGTLPFSEFADREVDFDIDLLLLPANVERAKHMAATRKPLRN